MVDCLMECVEEEIGLASLLSPCPSLTPTRGLSAIHLQEA